MTRRLRAAWLIAGAAVTALVMLLSGGLFVAHALPEQHAEQEHLYRRAVTRVELDSHAGDATLTPGPAGVVSVRRRANWSVGSQPEVRERWQGSTLQLSVRCPRGRGSGECSVDFDLSVPADVITDLRTEAGTLTVNNLVGSSRLASAVGDIAVTGARGDLWARTQRGSFTGSALHSRTVDVEAHVGDTDVGLSSRPQTVRAVSTVGDVKVTVPQGAYAVEMHGRSDATALGFSSDPAAAARITASAEVGQVDVRYGNG
jgi:hypothetical protein